MMRWGGGLAHCKIRQSAKVRQRNVSRFCVDYEVRLHHHPQKRMRKGLWGEVLELIYRGMARLDYYEHAPQTWAGGCETSYQGIVSRAAFCRYSP